MADIAGKPLGDTNRSTPVKRGRVEGLDSIRFLCAVIVVFDHLDFASLWMAGKPLSGVGKAIHGLLDCLFNGPAAVIAFFIISGFCIHYPFRGSRPLLLPAYLSRRLIRIGLPSAIFILYMRLVLKDGSPLQDTVLWSILCEITYYILYPLLRLCHQRIGWAWMTAVSFVTAYAIALSSLPTLIAGHNGYVALGAGRTWIIGLPCWLLGCWLAENYGVFSLLSTPRMWSLRAFVFLMTVLLRILKFHSVSPLASNVLTLNLFALLACFWIGSEIAYAAGHAPSPRLEWAGKWSYSIYLAHPLVLPSIALLGVAGVIATHPWAKLLAILVVFACSYLYYLAIELPSHHLAITVSRRLGRTEHQATPVPS